MHSTTENTMSTITPINVTLAGEYAFDRGLSEREAAIDADEHRDELIAEKKAELVAQRVDAMSNDDIICALQSGYAEHFVPQIRSALKEKNTVRAYAVLSSLVEIWIGIDSEIEAIKWMERMESDDHPARH
jgi:predicted ATP-binding protein involved in virulence